MPVLESAIQSVLHQQDFDHSLPDLETPDPSPDQSILATLGDDAARDEITKEGFVVVPTLDIVREVNALRHYVPTPHFDQVEYRRNWSRAHRSFKDIYAYQARMDPWEDRDAAKPCWDAIKIIWRILEETLDRVAMKKGRASGPGGSYAGA
ncbi:hypothetical protein MVEN_01135900 [Mycena venus]|uniref:Uncharacterized protein n=1 Tax=Mycena venus TaxID=2733690 RepID=A0A8H6Y8A7_9AGAR|nr:hypothetical protein MVEN_01135900 [Mycena venus]